jgi:hypothetical protein
LAPLDGSRKRVTLEESARLGWQWHGLVGEEISSSTRIVGPQQRRHLFECRILSKFYRIDPTVEESALVY